MADGFVPLDSPVGRVAAALGVDPDELAAAASVLLDDETLDLDELWELFADGLHHGWSVRELFDEGVRRADTG